MFSPEHFLFKAFKSSFWDRCSREIVVDPPCSSPPVTEPPKKKKKRKRPTGGKKNPKRKTQKYTNSHRARAKCRRGHR